MAVKIGKAIPERGPVGRDPVPAALYDKATHGRRPLCPGCSCRLKHTRASEQETGIARKRTPAYFGRLPNVSHERGCKYDIEATMKRLVAQSREVREYGDALLAYVSGHEDTVEFRLHVLLGELCRLGELRREQSLCSQLDDPQAAKDYQKLERRLRVYINCVGSILELADIVADHDSLAEVIRVVYDGQSIAWEDFFYGYEHTRLWHERARVAGRPVTVRFERRDEERGADKPYYTGRHYEISGREAKDTVDGQRLNIQVKLHVRDRALADEIWKFREVVVCGLPRFPTPDLGRQQGKRYAPFVHIVLPVDHPSQVFGVDGEFRPPQTVPDHRPRHRADRLPAVVDPSTELPNTPPSPVPDVPDHASTAIGVEAPRPGSAETSTRPLPPPAPERAFLAPAPVSPRMEPSTAPTPDAPSVTGSVIRLPPDVPGRDARPATQSPDTVPSAVYGEPATTSPLVEMQSGPDDTRPPQACTVAPRAEIAPDPEYGDGSVESKPPRPWRAATVTERPIVPTQRHAAVRWGMLASFTASCRGLVRSLAQRLLER